MTDLAFLLEDRGDIFGEGDRPAARRVPGVCAGGVCAPAGSGRVTVPIARTTAGMMRNEPSVFMFLLPH